MLVIHQSNRACENFDMLTNIEIMLTLMCIMPLVENIYSLITFAQSQFGFICNYVAIVKVFLGKKIIFSTPIQLINLHVITTSSMSSC